MPLAVLLALAAVAAGATIPAEPPWVAVVDPGHGGEKDGAIGPGGVREKDLTLQIARRVAARLRRQGARVVLTRSADRGVGLAERAARANAEGA